MKSILNNDEALQLSTGLRKDSFYTLLHRIEAKLTKTSLEGGSKINQSSGRSRSLSFSEQLLSTMIYLRHYCSLRFFAVILQIPYSTLFSYVSVTIDILYEDLRGELTFPKDNYTKHKNGCVFDQKLVVAIGDCSEQRCYSPANNDVDAEYLYSTKKKAHTISTFVMVSPNGIPYYKSESVGGSQLDITIATMEQNKAFFSSLCPKEYLGFDAGFRGYQEHWKYSIISEYYPTTYPDAKWHTWCAVRSVVENLFARVKKWLICSIPLRCKNLEELLSLHNRVWTICLVLIKMFEAPFKAFTE